MEWRTWGISDRYTRERKWNAAFINIRKLKFRVVHWTLQFCYERFGHSFFEGNLFILEF